MSVLAIIPARAGSKGIPGKNFTPLAGMSPVQRAIACALEIEAETWVTSDSQRVLGQASDSCYAGLIRRPADLATDTTPMVEVVKHVLSEIPGPDDQIICLLQPTQVLRRPEHVTAAIDLMNAGCARVVSVTPAESPDKLVRLVGCDCEVVVPWDGRAVERRQDARQAFKRDGTIYAWRRNDDNPLGLPAVALFIPTSETCALDSPEDWAEAERRLRER